MSSPLERSVYMLSDFNESVYISPKYNVPSLAESDVESTLSIRFVLYFNTKDGQNMRKKLTLELGGNTTVYEAMQKAFSQVHSLKEVKEITGRIYYSISGFVAPVELGSEEFNTVPIHDLKHLSSITCLIFDVRNHVGKKHGLAQAFNFWTIKV